MHQTDEASWLTETHRSHLALGFKNTVLLANRMLNRQRSLFSLTSHQILMLWHGSFKAHPDAQGSLQAKMHGVLMYLYCKPICSSMMTRKTAQGYVAYKEWKSQEGWRSGFIWGSHTNEWPEFTSHLQLNIPFLCYITMYYLCLNLTKLYQFVFCPYA